MHLKKWTCKHCGARNLKQPKRCEVCNKFRSSKVKKATRKKKPAPVVKIKSKLPPGAYTLRVDVAVNGKPTVVWVMRNHPRAPGTGAWRMADKLDDVFEDTLRKGIL